MERNNQFEESVIEAKRVAKKNSGGTKISFSALVVLGDRNGSIGYAIGKAPSLSNAIQKASSRAKRTLKKVNLVNGTIPYEIKLKKGSTKILIKPAPEGAGLIAGGSLRKVLELVGVRNVSAKVLGSRNKAANVRATIDLLLSLKSTDQIIK